MAPPHDCLARCRPTERRCSAATVSQLDALRRELLHFLVAVAVAVSGAGLVAPVAAPAQWCAAESGIAPAWIRAAGKEMPDAVGSPAVHGLV